MCHAVCLWNDMYIKLLIVKMSGEYLYFSLSVSLTIKNLYNIYVICSSQHFQSTFHPVSCSPRYWGLDSGISYINLVKILESLGHKLTSIRGCAWREDLFE